MFLTKSKIYEKRLIIPKFTDKDFWKNYIKYRDDPWRGTHEVKSQIKLSIFFSYKGATNWYSATLLMCNYGEKNLIDLYLSLKDNRKWHHNFLIASALCDHINQIQFFISKGIGMFKRDYVVNVCKKRYKNTLRNYYLKYEK